MITGALGQLSSPPRSSAGWRWPPDHRLGATTTLPGVDGDVMPDQITHFLKRDELLGGRRREHNPTGKNKRRPKK